MKILIILNVISGVLKRLNFKSVYKVDLENLIMSSPQNFPAYIQTCDRPQYKATMVRVNLGLKNLRHPTRSNFPLHLDRTGRLRSLAPLYQKNHQKPPIGQVL